MIVTGGTACGQSHPYFNRGRCSVHGIAIDPFLSDTATFSGRYIATVKAGSNLLINRAVGQEVARQLPSGKFIERQVLIKCFDHPVPVQPHASFIIQMQTVCIGITGKVQPKAGHMLPISSPAHQIIDDFLPGIGGLVADKGIQFFQRWR